MNSFLPLTLSWISAYLALSVHFLLALLFASVAGVLLIRVFIIFHDCCHRAFFQNRRLNELVGFVTGVLTFTPYEQWRNTHVTHHATSGNLDKRGTGDIWTLTVQEYSQLTRWKKFVYRMYRNPLLMFTVGPIYVFMFDYRLNRPRISHKERWNTYATNLGIIGLMAALTMTFGWQAVVFVQIPMFMISGMAGIWLFYVQHQFEESYYESNEQWNYKHAALRGSSFFQMPKLLEWLTGNIGYHHIHHLNPRVPNYFLPIVYDKYEEIRDVPTLTLRSSFATLRLRLWNEDTQKMVGWREWRRINKDTYPKKKIA